MANQDKKQQDARQAADEAAEKEAQAEMERRLAEIERNPDLTEEERTRQMEEAQGTKGSPRGAGRKYEDKPSGSQNTMGKASATRAGGDPVHSPVIGNPGEANPIAGNYDYAIAAKVGNPNAATERLNAPDVAGGSPRRADPRQAEFKHPMRVRAIRKGEYGGVREVNDEFDNDRNLAPYPEDEKSWFVPIDEGEYKEAQSRGDKLREEKEARRIQDEEERAGIAKLLAGRGR